MAAAMPPRLNLRHSIAPRVLDNTLPMRTLTSTARFSVRVEPPRRDVAAINPDSPILATFVWKDSGARVQLSGSFDDWRKHEMTYVPGVGYFVLVVELPPGEYFYRFVVDGRWKIADGDCNLREDPFGEMSHFLEINDAALQDTTPNRFSTAALSRVDLPRNSAGAPRESDEDDDASDGKGSKVSSGDENQPSDDAACRAFAAQMEPIRIPRQKGEEFINDYDDDACGELDLQADVYEAMYDVKDVLSEDQTKTLVLPTASELKRREKARQRKKPGQTLVRNVFAKLFGRDGSLARDSVSERPPAPISPYSGVDLAPPEILRQVDEAQKPKKRLRVWFPTERNFPAIRGRGRKVDAKESEHVLDVSGTALRFNLAEENANSRQQLGKALFTQGKYDAALALYSLSVKIREDNGLRNSKSTAVAHTDVASAFIHLGDLKNAEKHLNMAVAIFERNTFSGGDSELGDVHQFLAVVSEMQGALFDAEKSYRSCIRLYEKAGVTRTNPNYETAKQNLKDNLRRQREGKNTLSWPKPPSKADAPPAQNSPTNPRDYVKASISGAVRPGGPTPETLSTVNSFPGTESVSLYHGRTDADSSIASARGKPQNLHLLDPSALASAEVYTPPRSKLPPALSEYEAKTGEPGDSEQSGCESRPATWKALAEVARASMPTAPLEGENKENDEEDSESGLGTYEEMSRGWQRDGRQLLIENNFTEAIDMYTLAIYTRKRHGPWASKANAETHVEYARCLFATKDMKGACEALKDAVTIIEKMNMPDLNMMLGQVWGNLGCALDRLGGHQKEAETAHATGMAAYGRAGLSKEDPRWTKAWRNLCVSVKAQGTGANTVDNVWGSIESQIRGASPMTTVATVKIQA